jgi:hypothetical protein
LFSLSFGCTDGTHRLSNLKDEDVYLFVSYSKSVATFAFKAYSGVEEYIQTFLASILGRGVWSSLLPGLFTPEEGAPFTY